MAYKRERLEKIIEREVGKMILFDIKDDRIHFVTITNVNLTGDLSIATIYFTVFGNQNQIDNSSKALFEAKGYIRSMLSKRLTVRKVPDIIFKYDNSYAEGLKIEQILGNIQYSTDENVELDNEKYKEK